MPRYDDPTELEIGPDLESMLAERLEALQAGDPAFEITSTTLPDLFGVAVPTLPETTPDVEGVVAYLVEDGVLVWAGRSQRSRDPVSVYNLSRNAKSRPKRPEFIGVPGLAGLL